jgi:hypothetical protein
VPNSAPLISGTFLTPSSLKTNDLATVQVAATDPDNDPITFTYVWKVNGNVVQTTSNTSATTDTLDLSIAGHGDRGDYIEVEVTPYDGSDPGLPVSTGTIVVNSAPLVTSVSDQHSLRGDSISLQISATDVDGDTLTFAADGLPAGLSIDASTGLISGTIAGDAVPGTYQVNISVSDGSSYTVQSFAWTIYRTPAELYADYLAAVADANAAYLAAIANRDAAIAAARQQAQSQADALYAEYLTTVTSAQAVYDAAIAAAESAYNAALADADAAWESATADARAAYEAALANAQAAYDAAISALDANYQAAIAAADEAYAAYLAPYQQARDDAYAAWQADPQNSQLEQEYNDAQAALDAAILTATAQRDDAYAAAQASRDAGAANAQAELLAAQDAAFAEYQTAIAPANAEWDEAEAAAWAVYLTAKQAADDQFLASETAAWQDYLNGVAGIESELATTVASIAAQYEEEVTSAVAAWQAAEATAWDAYTTAMASLPGTPPLTERIVTSPAAVEIPAPPTNPPQMLALGPRLVLPLWPLFIGQPQPEPEYGTREFWLTRPRRSARDGGLNITAEQRRDVVQDAIAALDTTFRLETIPVLRPNDPAPRWIQIGRDRAATGLFEGGLVFGGIATPAQLARIHLRVNLIHLKQHLVDSFYNMVVNNPPSGRQWTEEDRRDIANAMNRTADDLIRMVDLFLRTHPGAKPSLDSRHWWQNRFSAPWCADWAGAMRAWITAVITSRGPQHPANRYLQFEWGQANHMGYQHNFIIIKPSGHTVQLSTPENDAVDRKILLFDPWRDLLPRAYPATPWSQRPYATPTKVPQARDIEEYLYYFDRLGDPRFSDPYLGLGEFYRYRTR